MLIQRTTKYGQSNGAESGRNRIIGSRFIAEIGSIDFLWFFQLDLFVIDFSNPIFSLQSLGR